MSNQDKKKKVAIAKKGSRRGDRRQGEQEVRNLLLRREDEE